MCFENCNEAARVPDLPKERFVFIGNSSVTGAKMCLLSQEAQEKTEAIAHKTVYTAYDKAATLKVKPNVIGKTLVLKADKDLIMVLAPGNKNLDLVKIKKAAKAKKVDFISETIIKNKFKGIKLGAIPPLGELWKLSGGQNGARHVGLRR